MSEERLLEKIEEQTEAQKNYEINSIRSKVPADRMSQEFCDCGERIHVERRIRGYTNCIECATEAEASQRLFSRQ
jgi:RNA polymerase-binding transcription factor DksA